MAVESSTRQARVRPGPAVHLLFLNHFHSLANTISISPAETIPSTKLIDPQFSRRKAQGAGAGAPLVCQPGAEATSHGKPRYCPKPDEWFLTGGSSSWLVAYGQQEVDQESLVSRDQPLAVVGKINTVKDSETGAESAAYRRL